MHRSDVSESVVGLHSSKAILNAVFFASLDQFITVRCCMWNAWTPCSYVEDWGQTRIKVKLTYSCNLLTMWRSAILYCKRGEEESKLPYPDDTFYFSLLHYISCCLSLDRDMKTVQETILWLATIHARIHIITHSNEYVFGMFPDTSLSWIASYWLYTEWSAELIS